jgi:hypothetical protein
VRGETSQTLKFLGVVFVSAVSAGLMVIAATVLAVDVLRTGADAGNVDLRLYLLFGGTLAGLLLAAWATWRLLTPIASAYRRGGLAIVSAFATVIVMLICIPVNEALGHRGLIGLAALSGSTAVLLALLASRLRTRV